MTSVVRLTNLYIRTDIAAGSSQKSPRRGLRLKAQGWPRFLRPTLGKGFKLMSTLKGLCLDATPTGLTDDATCPQGWPQKTRPTLGFVTQPRCGCLPGASAGILP